MILTLPVEDVMKKLACAGALVALQTAAAATEIVYTPVNPSFGGNPLNGPLLLNIANAINKYQDPALEDALSRFSPTGQDLFNQQLNSAILGRVAGSLTNVLFDANNKFVAGTSLETATLLVTVSAVPNQPNAVTVTTLDKLTGATTSFTINQP
jgi:curli production assembly/transport component CsgF